MKLISAHSITRGWVANEIFRRVEPQGRTMGKFLQDEISGPLDIDVNINVSADQVANICPGKMLGIGYQLGQSLVPWFAGRKVEPNLIQFALKLARLFSSSRQGSRSGGPEPIRGLGGLTGLSLIDSEIGAKGETPSAGSKCTARGLAKLAAAMANGGSFGGQQLISEDGVQALYANKETRVGFAYVPTSLNVFDLPNERGKAYQQAVMECLSA